MENQPTLSPAAQAVFEAAWAAYWHELEEIRHSGAGPELIAAAVIRAVADLVAPEGYQSFTGHIEWDQGLEARNDSIREELLAIVDELEGQ